MKTIIKFFIFVKVKPVKYSKEKSSSNPTRYMKLLLSVFLLNIVFTFSSYAQNEIEAEVKNVNLNIKKAEKDVTGPQISITSPTFVANSYTVENQVSELKIVGKATDVSGIVKVLFGIKPVQKLDGAGNFEHSLFLIPGKNEITIEATDMEGNASKVTLSITRKNETIEQVKEIATTLKWTSPQNNSKSAEKSITIQACVTTTSKKIDTKIYVNNVLKTNKAVGSFEFRNDCNFTVSEKIELNNGANSIRLDITDENGKTTTSETLNVTYNQSTNTNYALFFATDNYTSWSKLNNPIKDAQTIATELKESYGFVTEVNENLAQQKIIAKIREYNKKIFNTNDQLLIFISGHGKFDDVFKQGFVVCSDSKLNDETGTTLISHDNLRTYVSNINCNHILLVMDVCFGGTFDRSIAESDNRGNEENNEMTQQQFIERKMKFKTCQFITSGGKEYVPDGRAGQHSPFTRQFLQALRNYGGNDKIITLNELKSYLEKVTPEPRWGEISGKNEPGSDFLFIAR